MDDLSSRLELTPEMIDEITEASLNGEELPYCVRNVCRSKCGGFILIHFRRPEEKGYSIRTSNDVELVQALRQLMHYGVLPSHEGATFDLRPGAVIHEPTQPIIFNIRKGVTN